MASPSDKSNDDFAYFISRMRAHRGDAADASAYHHETLVNAWADAARQEHNRRSSDLVLTPGADGTFGLPPKHDFERGGDIVMAWDLGSPDGDVVVIATYNPDGSLTFTDIEEVDAPDLVRGELGTMHGFTFTETKKR